jgi:anti-sigma regulatory factor (Ser/Thr protein kinase)
MARCEIVRENDFINISGDFLYIDLFFLLANIHKAVEDRGFSDLTLNFKGCTSAYAQEMVVLCAQIIAKRQNGIYIHLNLPEDEHLQKLFQNANWANLIDPRRYEPAPNTFYSAGHIPATQYTSSNEQFTIVNKIVDNILGAIPDMKREDFSAFEWAINEITDNVLTHAQSSVGGVVALSLSPRKKKVNYVVADAGLGIANTLRSGEHKGITDVHGLQMAIREGVIDVGIAQRRKRNRIRAHMKHIMRDFVFAQVGGKGICRIFRRALGKGDGGDERFAGVAFAERDGAVEIDFFFCHTRAFSGCGASGRGGAGRCKDVML